MQLNLSNVKELLKFQLPVKSGIIQVQAIIAQFVSGSPSLILFT